MSVLFVIMFGLSFRGRHAWLRRLVVRTPPFQGGDRRFEPGRSYHKQAGRRREASDLFCAGSMGPKPGTSGFLVPVAVGRSPLGSLANRGPMGPQVRVAGLQGARRDPLRREPASSGRGTASRRPRSARFHDMRGITPGRANHGRAKRLLSCHSGRPCHSGTASARPCHSEIIAGRLPPRQPSSCSLFAGRAILRFGESR